MMSFRDCPAGSFSGDANTVTDAALVQVLLFLPLGVRDVDRQVGDCPLSAGRQSNLNVVRKWTARNVFISASPARVPTSGRTSPFSVTNPPLVSVASSALSWMHRRPPE